MKRAEKHKKCKSSHRLANATKIHDQLKPGDLVFFNTMRRTFSHVGIYLGDNHFLHAPRTGAEVRVENMDNSYWMARYNGARRILEGN